MGNEKEIVEDLVKGSKFENNNENNNINKANPNQQAFSNNPDNNQEKNHQNVDDGSAVLEVSANIDSLDETVCETMVIKLNFIHSRKENLVEYFINCDVFWYLDLQQINLKKLIIGIYGVLYYFVWC